MSYKRLLLRAVPSANFPRKQADGTTYVDENEVAFTSTDRRALVLAIRGDGTVSEEHMRDLCQVAHEMTQKDVVAIFLGRDHDLEVYEIEEEARDTAFDLLDEDSA